MEEEKWTDNMKKWMDIDEVLLDEQLYEDRGYLYFGTSQLKKNCFSITVPGTGPLHITKENGIKLADAIYKSEGVDLRAEVTRLTAERDRLRQVTKALVDTWAPDSDPGFDAVYRTWKAAYDAVYPNSTKKFGKPDSALESEAPND